MGRTVLRRPIMRIPASLVLLLLAAPALRALGPAAPSRGELLYSTHGIVCHPTRMHWRDQRRARDWESLKAQVRRWQGEAQLQWSEEDIEAVARHLNETIYRFPQDQAQR
jgi:hypothetical protein